MQDFRSRWGRRVRRSAWLALFFLIPACGGDEASLTSGIDTGGKGGVVFNLRWSDAGTGPMTRQLTCEAAGVETVFVQIKGRAGEVVAEGGPWPCTVHEATITDIPASQQVTVAVFGNDAGETTQFKGRRDNVSIPPGQTTDLGTIDMRAVTHFDSRYLQYRRYADPAYDRFQGRVDLTVSGRPAPPSHVQKISLFGPDGTEVPIAETRYNAFPFIYASQSTPAGAVDFTGPFDIAYYEIRFPAPRDFPAGWYNYMVENVYGDVETNTLYYPGKTEPPIPDENAMSHLWHADGSLSLSWQNPTGEYDRIMVNIFDENHRGLLAFSGPAATDQFTLPAEWVQTIDANPAPASASWHVLTWRVTDDGNNYARGISPSKSLNWGVKYDDTPPRLVDDGCIPPNGAVADLSDWDQTIRLLFSEPMDQSRSAYRLDEILTGPGVVQTGWESNGTVYALHFGAPVPNGTYHILLNPQDTDPAGGFADLAGNPLPEDTRYEFTQDDGSIDLTGPMVTAVSPAAGAVDVSVDTSVSASFSEALDSATLNEDTLRLFDLTDPDAPVPVPGNITYDSVAYTAVFTPDSPLSHQTAYAGQISGAVADLSGNAMAAPFGWGFTTAIDLTPPAVLSILPENGATGIPPTTTEVLVTFSKPIDPATVSTDTFAITHEGPTAVETVPGTYSVSTNMVYFLPDSLSPETRYDVTLSPGITDTNGVSLGDTLTSYFVTGSDQFAVISVEPAEGSENVPLGAEINIVFNQPVQVFGFDDANFHLDILSSGEWWHQDGEILWNDDYTRLTFIPYMLEPFHEYSINLQDINSLTGGYIPSYTSFFYTGS